MRFGNAADELISRRPFCSRPASARSRCSRRAPPVGPRIRPSDSSLEEAGFEFFVPLGISASSSWGTMGGNRMARPREFPPCSGRTDPSRRLGRLCPRNRNRLVTFGRAHNDLEHRNAVQDVLGWDRIGLRAQPYRRAKDFPAPNHRATDRGSIPPLLKLTMPSTPTWSCSDNSA